jgi:uncharacterized protein YPO0396
MFAKDIRLSEMTVCNWGVFRDIHTFAVPRRGLYITGENATGKSTLTDAYTALFRSPGHSDFNAAAAQRERGRKGDGRNVVTYMRNLYSRDPDGGPVYARNDPPFVSLIRGVFTESDAGGAVDGGWAVGGRLPVRRTLAVLFHLEDESDSVRDVKRLYIIGRGEIAPGDILGPILETGLWNGRGVRKLLEEKYDGVQCHDDFSRYEQSYMSMFRIRDSKALTLLNKAIGMKQVGNITSLVREFTLEDFEELRREADLIVNVSYVSFQEARRVYKECRRKYEVLTPLRGLAEEWQKLAGDLDACVRTLADVRIYVGKRRHAAALDALETNRRRIAENEARIGTDQARRGVLEEERVRLLVEIERVGGVDLDRLRADVRRCQDALKRIRSARELYETAAREFGIPIGTSQGVFDAARRRAEELRKAFNEEIEGHLRRREELAADVRTMDGEIGELGVEIEALKSNSRSNMPAAFMKFRTRLAAAMGVQGSGTEIQDRLPFVAELMDIPGELDDWRGAIERSMGTLRTTIVTGDPIGDDVLEWLGNHHKVRVDLLRAGSPTEDAPEVAGGFVARLRFKDGYPHEAWLTRLLAKRDRRLVEAPEFAGDGVPCLSKSGIETFGPHRVLKEDEIKLGSTYDRKSWMIGLDNREKLAALEGQRDDLRTRRNRLDREVRDVDGLVGTVRGRCARLEKFAGTLLEQIDSAELETEEARLLEILKLNVDPEGEISRMRARLKANRDEAAILRKTIDRLSAESLALAKESETHDDTVKATQADADAPLPEGTMREFDGRAANTPLARLGDVLARHYEAERQRTLNAQATLGAGIEALMRGFNGEFPSDSTELVPSIGSLDDYLKLLDRVEKDDLRNYEARDASQRKSMADNVFSAFTGMLDSGAMRIVERLKVINRKLKDIGFVDGNYLQLVWEDRKSEEVRKFEALRHRLFRQIGDNDEQLFATLDQIIGILRDALRTPDDPLIDPRQRFVFRVEERRRTGDDEEDPVVFTMASTEGQSGGQKESFTGVILAACLGYVLIPDGARQPVFRTVFLDEAFANTKPEWSARVLQVFTRLGFQTNLVSHRNLGIARDFTGGVLYCRHRRIADGVGESSLSEMQWDEFLRLKDGDDGSGGPASGDSGDPGDGLGAVA